MPHIVFKLAHICPPFPLLLSSLLLPIKEGALKHLILALELSLSMRNPIHEVAGVNLFIGEGE